MNIVLSPIKPSEEHLVLTLFKEAAEKISKKDIDHWQYWKNPPIEKIKWVREGILNNEFFFIKNAKQQTIGMIRVLEKDLLYWGKKNDNSKHIHSLVIIEKLEGKGMGKIVLQKIESDAKKSGCTYLRLDADSKNPKLCSYYEKQGFKKVGTKKLPLSTYNLYQKEIK